MYQLNKYIWFPAFICGANCTGKKVRICFLYFIFMLILLNSLHTHLSMHWLIHIFISHHQFISCLYHCIRRVSWLEKINSFPLRIQTRYEIFGVCIYSFFFFLCFMEYDNLIMTLSRVCFLYRCNGCAWRHINHWLVKKNDWLFEAGARKEKINWLLVTNILSLSLALFFLYDRREFK